VYHKALRASPWWDAASFRLTGVLRDMFTAVDEGGQVQQQLDDLIALRAGSLRDVRAPDVAEAILNRSEPSLSMKLRGHSLVCVCVSNMHVC
jgi:hypothetical protein